MRAPAARVLRSGSHTPQDTNSYSSCTGPFFGWSGGYISPLPFGPRAARASLHLQRRACASSRGVVGALEGGLRLLAHGHAQVRAVDAFEKALAGLNLSTKLAELDASDQIACTPAAINAAATNPDVNDKLEKLVTEWCEMSETILANDSSEQLVSSSGEVNGPRTELEHWRTYATPPGPTTHMQLCLQPSRRADSPPRHQPVLHG